GFQRREFFSRSREHLRLHVVLLAADEVESRERAREHRAEVLLEILRRIGRGHFGESCTQLAEDSVVHVGRAFTWCGALSRCPSVVRDYRGLRRRRCQTRYWPRVWTGMFAADRAAHICISPTPEGYQHAKTAQSPPHDRDRWALQPRRRTRR